MSIDPQLVIAETLAAGIPVIASNQRSNPEFIVEGETGLLVPLGDVEATTTALDEILSDLEKAAEMGRAAKEDIAARWNWDNYAEELIEAYEKVIR
jgi:glycosyltransferase involved in cell wall biosynthesis